ncbi:hypothetical protein R3P38DRAFT_3194864 [Favolaschia claudopus]|uniref:Uncharacterized protein n=1 Tax=Favolaschia claudopus TaxID=2862362 RepID=A0AAV9ZM37_9AGAR
MVSPVVPVLKGTASMHEFPILTPGPPPDVSASTRVQMRLLSSNPAVDSNTNPILQTTCVQSGTFYKWSSTLHGLHGRWYWCYLHFYPTSQVRGGLGGTTRLCPGGDLLPPNSNPAEAYREASLLSTKQRFSMLSQVEAIHDFTRLSYLHMLFGVYDYPTDVKTLVIQRMQGMQEAFELSAVEDYSVSATKYPRPCQAAHILDQQTVTLDSFSGLLGEIAKDKTLYDAFYSVKNSYHQTAVGSNGVIGGRYPLILELCAKIKAERELQRGNTRSFSASTPEQEFAKAPRSRAKKDNKTKKSKATIEDGDESPFDDSELPWICGRRHDCGRLQRRKCLWSPGDSVLLTSATLRETSQSGSTRPSSAMAILARTDPSSASAIVVEDFPVPPPRKTCTFPPQPLAHEDSVEQYDATDLSVNNPTVRQTVAEARDAVKKLHSPIRWAHYDSKKQNFARESASRMPNSGITLITASTCLTDLRRVPRCPT